jgi:glycosyltransferase involved in cell wall biosynthesis
MDLYVDVSCLQDPEYAFRGIGHHSAALLRHARGGLGPDVRIVGLVTPELPALDPAHRALLDETRAARTPRLSGRPALFVQPSPMTHPQWRLAPLLGRADLLTCAVVYDFIPLDRPGYLPTPAARRGYIANLAWLKQYDLFAPISAFSATRLGETLGVAGERVRVTGACVRDTFAGPDGGALARRTPPCRFASERYAVTVGGDDPRKNTELIVRAHARLGGTAGLVIVGRLTADFRDAFRRAAADAGGDPDRLEFVEGIDDAGLAALYRHAAVAVSASRIEGFSLPLVEAVTVGCPALASRIDAHRELLGDGALFDADDPSDLARRLADVLDTPGRRAELLDAQRPLAARYGEAAVAGRFWAHARAGLGRRQSPAVVRRGSGRPRIAFLTPFPPDRTGVADYTARSIAAIGADADVDVYTPGVRPDGHPRVRRFEPLSERPYVSGEYDRVVAVLGNSDHHARILEYHRRYGGPCIAHDDRMAELYAVHLGPRRFADMAERCLGRPVSVEESQSWIRHPETLPTPFYDDILPHGDPLLVHSRPLRAHLARLYGREVAHLPFCHTRTVDPRDLTPGRRAEARRRLGLPAGDVIVATFGSVGPATGPLECVWALEFLRAWGVPARLVYVGDAGACAARLRALAESLGLADHVVTTAGRPGRRDYDDYLLAADLGLQLRGPGSGGPSGALMDCIGVGLPTVANDAPAAAVDAPDYVALVPDQFSPLLIAERLHEWYQSGRHRTRDGESRTRHVEEHTFAAYAEGLFRALGLA